MSDDGGAPRRVVVGTAGHVDHGKTRLVEALTGIDCDRWEEEKERGITIDLGFAHLEEGDLQVGFVDVPGHERFVDNALAGLGGIRILLLVVAADAGIEEQTREHLAICSLLGIPSALVALTKRDLVDDDLAELARLEVEELLAPTPFAGAPVVPVSSLTGEGVPEVRRRLLALADEHAFAAGAVGPAAGPVRLPVDRAFHLKGLGVVVTGTLAAGAVGPGDRLELLPGGGEVRVRSIQVHGAAREEAAAGERTALQLSGVELDGVGRGSQLVTPGSLAETTSLLVDLELVAGAPAELSGWTPVRLHLFAGEVTGRARPLGTDGPGAGERGVVEVRLEAPLAAARGDRVVVRRPSPPDTLGGGVILDPAWRRRRGEARAKAVAGLSAGLDAALRVWLEEAREAGAAAADLARRAGAPRDEVEERLRRLAAAGRALAVADAPGGAARWIAPATFARVARRAGRVLGEFFAADRLARGMPKAEAVGRILGRRGAPLADTYLAWLEAQDVLAVEGDRVNLPGRRPQLAAGESKLAADVVARFDAAGLTPPSPGELRAELGAKPQILDGVVRYLVGRGKLVQLPGGLIAAASAVDRLVADLAASGWERFSVPAFKERFDLSRKWAIPLLEHLDSIGATRRLGDERQIVRRTPTTFEKETT